MNWLDLFVFNKQDLTEIRVQLHRDVLLLIFKELDLSSLICCVRVCQAWNHIIRNQNLLLKKKKEVVSWKWRHYKQTCEQRHAAKVTRGTPRSIQSFLDEVLEAWILGCDISGAFRDLVFGTVVLVLVSFASSS